MFESIEIKKVANGFIVLLVTEEDAKEYIFTSHRHVLKFIKDYIDTKPAASE